MKHSTRPCSVCDDDARYFLEIGDITVYLCESHDDFCAQCMAVVEEEISHEGNICSHCLKLFPDTYAELAYYECYPDCRDCGL